MKNYRFGNEAVIQVEIGEEFCINCPNDGVGGYLYEIELPEFVELVRNEQELPYIHPEMGMSVGGGSTKKYILRVNNQGNYEAIVRKKRPFGNDPVLNHVFKIEVSQNKPDVS